MGLNDEYHYEEPGGAKKYGFLMGIGLMVLVGIGLVLGQIAGGKHEPPGKMPEVVMITSSTV